jgi:hypothetical protein
MMTDVWHPIETAPKDVLIRLKCEWFNNPDKTIVIEALCQEDGVHFENGQGLVYDWTPTGWADATGVPGGIVQGITKCSSAP